MPAASPPGPFVNLPALRRRRRPGLPNAWRPPEQDRPRRQESDQFCRQYV